ncbi:MAG: Na+/H+ antiporter NhaA [Paracoccaceae bacterium]|nr:MAG: Na+/H+ antiporter NhaA [Paracoccaceae bacterium]
MTPVSPHLTRAAWAFLAGSAVATLAATLVPGSYYDAVEWRLFDLPAWLIPGRDSIPRTFTPMQVVEEIVMAAVLFLFAKEGWEAVRCENGAFAGRQARGPLLAAAAGMAVAAAIWAAAAWLTETAPEAEGTPGWAVPIGGEVLLAWLVARTFLGARSAAVQLVLFMGIAGLVIGTVVGGLAAPGGAGLRPLWLGLPAAAALAGYLALTRPLAHPDLAERMRARLDAVWPWAGLAALSWLGVALAGLPPALGFLPILPAMPHARQSFGLFAAAETFLSDPLNRVSQVALPLLPPAMLAFGLTHGGVDAGATAAATGAALAALVLAKPAGIAAGLAVVRRLDPAALPQVAQPRDLLAVALAGGISVTGATLLLEPALPGGAVREAARAGLWISAAVLALAIVALRAARRGD